MEGMRFTRNRQNTRSFGKFLAGNPTRLPCSLTLKCVRRYSSSQVTSDSVSRSETCRSVLFEIEIPCILLFLNRNKNSHNSPKRMHPRSPLPRTFNKTHPNPFSNLPGHSFNNMTGCGLSLHQGNTDAKIEIKSAP